MILSSQITPQDNGTDTPEGREQIFQEGKHLATRTLPVNELS
jgi:hypothetical protein